MTDLGDAPEHSRMQKRSAFVPVVILIAALAGMAHGIIHLLPAQNFGALLIELVTAGFVGMFVAFLVSASFTSGGSGSLGAAVFGLLVELVVIAIALGFAGYWPLGVAIVHERAQWTLFGIQTLYLLFVTLA